MKKIRRKASISVEALAMAGANYVEFGPVLNSREADPRPPPYLLVEEGLEMERIDISFRMDASFNEGRMKKKLAAWAKSCSFFFQY